MGVFPPRRWSTARPGGARVAPPRSPAACVRLRRSHGGPCGVGPGPWGNPSRDPVLTADKRYLSALTPPPPARPSHAHPRHTAEPLTARQPRTTPDRRVAPPPPAAERQPVAPPRRPPRSGPPAGRLPGGSAPTTRPCSPARTQRSRRVQQCHPGHGFSGAGRHALLLQPHHTCCPESIDRLPDRALLKATSDSRTRLAKRDQLCHAHYGAM